MSIWTRAMNRILSPILILSTLACFALPCLAAPGNALKSLPIQDGGRIKPFKSFAQEMLEVVYGSKTFKPEVGPSNPAEEIVLTWVLSPEAWKDKLLFEVKNFEVLTKLDLPSKQRHFRGDDIFLNPKLQPLMMELEEKRKSKEKLTPYVQALQRLENQFFVFREIASGRLLRLVPPLPGGSDSWISVAEFTPDFQESFAAVSRAFVATLDTSAPGGPSEKKQILINFDEAVKSFEARAKAHNPVLYPSDAKIAMEVHYLKFHPFRWAYVSYLIAGLLIMGIWMFSGQLKKADQLYLAAVIFSVIGFVLHTYGFFLRVYIMDRAPVTNMYETVVWVSWGSILFAYVLEYFYRFRFVLMAGAFSAVICLVVADNAPAVLDASLQPLEPVLRSNYWLTIHVMTITVSYSAFLLAFILGDIGLVYVLKDENKFKDHIEKISLVIYRSIQIGVVLLFPGIVLGGIWADYSWGRFWGWDPKETWALIALLGYIAVWHGRLAGLIKSFGMLISGVATFSLVIMAWYGVNFVLGAGLHSYGFGAGGVEYVSFFVLAHFAFASFVAYKRHSRIS
ncbi:MAG: cytochrome c biogenesis protein [Pseudobdellovibrionaceae bacterium]